MTYKAAFFQISPSSFLPHTINFNLSSFSAPHTFAHFLWATGICGLWSSGVLPCFFGSTIFFLFPVSFDIFSASSTPAYIPVVCNCKSNLHGQSNCRFQQVACALWARKLSVLVPETYQHSAHAGSLAICVS